MVHIRGQCSISDSGHQFRAVTEYNSARDHKINLIKENESKAMKARGESERNRRKHKKEERRD